MERNVPVIKEVISSVKYGVSIACFGRHGVLDDAGAREIYTLIYRVKLEMVHKLPRKIYEL